MPNINSILKNSPVSARYGAPMGARSFFSEQSGRLYLQPVRMVDYDYSPDGTYWGGNSRHGRIWCAFNGESRIFVRAVNRADALQKVRAEFPAATFYRGAA